MRMIRSARKTTSSVEALLYFVWLVLAWTTYVATVYPLVMGRPSVSAALLNNAVRFGIFAMPVIVLTRRWQPSQLQALGITTGWRHGLAVGAVVGICWASAATGVAVFVQGKTVHWNAIAPLLLTSISSITIVVEELSFRSYLQQAFASKGTVFAIVAAAAGFTLIHFPGWLFLNLLPSWTTWLTTSVSIFILGCLLGVVFARTKSLWACVLVHALNNVAAAVCVATDS